MPNYFYLISVTLATISLFLLIPELRLSLLKAKILSRLNKSASDDKHVFFTLIQSGLDAFTSCKVVRNEYSEMREALETTGRYSTNAQYLYLLSCWLLPISVVVVSSFVSSALTVILLSSTAFIFPRKIIRGMAKKTERIQNLEAIQLCQITRMLLEAGLSLERALRLIAAQSQPVMPNLISKVNRYNRMMESGAERTLALSEMGKNPRVIVLRSYVNLMKQSSSLGSKISDSLLQIVVEAQHSELNKIKEETNKLAAKMTIIMMIFMLPAMFLLIGGPALFQIVNILEAK